MYQYRSPAGLVLRDDPLVEGQHGGGIVWDSVVWPGCEVELLKLHGPIAALSLVEGGKEGSKGEGKRGREGARKAEKRLTYSQIIGICLLSPIFRPTQSQAAKMCGQ